MLEALLPALPAEKRYDALMIANAIGIAVREIADGARTGEEEASDLAAFLETETADPEDLAARLAAAIRAGRHDGMAELHRLLEDSAVRRQRINNPKILAGRDDG